MATLAGSALRPERFPFKNGLVLLHNRAAANPSVVVRLLVRAGASRETASEYGVASLTGRMLRQGTEHIEKNALAEELDGMGAGLSVDVGYALVVVSIKCLSGDFSRAMEIIGELVMRPTFPAFELERLRGQVLTRVTRDELKAFQTAWYGPNQATLLVVGDVPFDEAATAAERIFGAWPSARLERVESTLPASDLPGLERREVSMVGKAQADIVLGVPTLDRASPDYYALSFANHILGRIYFMGRFGEKVRDEQGLAYYAYSELNAGYGRGGWIVRAGVNPTNLDRALESVSTELRRFLADGPTDAEQADGVASLLGSLPRQLETNEDAAAVISEIELYGLGLDYLERYPDIVRSLTREQVTEAARRWIDTQHLVTSIAGPPRGG